MNCVGVWSWVQMQELLPIPNSSCFLSILFLPKSSDSVSHRYNDLEDTLSRANAWHTASQASGVPIVFMNIQTESLLTKISGETASSTVSAGSLSDLTNLANVSLYGFEDYHGVDIGVVRGVFLWFAPIGGEVAVEIKIKDRDSKLGFAIGRTQEATLKAVTCKVTKHDNACIENQHVFIPFAFDTFGFLAPEAVEFLNKVQRVIHSNVMSPRSTKVVFKKISFAIQKGLAAQLIALLPSVVMY